MSVSTDGLISADFDNAELFLVESADVIDTAIDSLNGCVTSYYNNYHIVV